MNNSKKSIYKLEALKKEIEIPGDKSISHRSIMFGSISEGITEITHFLKGADCLSTISCFRKMGISIEETPSKILVHGKGLHGLTAPLSTLDCGNSGTTTRLLSGILAGQNFDSILTGDSSIQKRPMKRIIEPLSFMNATIKSLSNNGCAPLQIQGHPLTGIEYLSPVSSAQVKSAILLAGLYADSETSVIEPSISRNHSEIMLKNFGATINTSNTKVTIQPNPCLTGQKVSVPGDISSAAYFIAAAIVIPNSEILIKNVGINPTRSGIIQILSQMGAKIDILNSHYECGELAADILVHSCDLTGTIIEGDIIPTLIDEIPIIAILAAYAKGTTIIKDASELKVKESNRIDTVVQNLINMGADVIATDDGMIIHGGRPLHGTQISTKLDHRIAMSFTIAGLFADGETILDNFSCVDISFPNFFELLNI